MKAIGSILVVFLGVLLIYCSLEFPLWGDPNSPASSVDPVSARSHSILIVEIGVGITVMAVMVALYYNLSSAGKQDEGL